MVQIGGSLDSGRVFNKKSSPCFQKVSANKKQLFNIVITVVSETFEGNEVTLMS